LGPGSGGIAGRDEGLELALAWCPPLGIDFSYDLPNKPLTESRNLQAPESKGDNLQDLENKRVMVSLENWGDTSLRLVDSVST
jgi:hypothetical protein